MACLKSRLKSLSLITKLFLTQRLMHTHAPPQPFPTSVTTASIKPLAASEKSTLGSSIFRFNTRSSCFRSSMTRTWQAQGWGCALYQG